MRWIVLAAVLAVQPVWADNRVPLAEDTRLENGLVVVAIGNYIRRNCGSIEARSVRGLSFLWSLQGRARDLGYSRDEIEAYIDSEPDKARVDRKARAYLSRQGVDFDDPDTFCRVGRAEIAAKSTAGTLLRTTN